MNWGPDSLCDSIRLYTVTTIVIGLSGHREITGLRIGYAQIAKERTQKKAR